MKTNETKRRDRAVRPLRRGEGFPPQIRNVRLHVRSLESGEREGERDFIPTADGNKYVSPAGLQLGRRHSSWRVRLINRSPVPGESRANPRATTSRRAPLVNISLSIALD